MPRSISDFQRDPINTAFQVIQQRTGISDALTVAGQVVAAHSPEHVRQFHVQLRDAEIVAGAFIAAYPDVDQEAVFTALGKFPRSGNMAADLAKALRDGRAATLETEPQGRAQEYGG